MFNASSFFRHFCQNLVFHYFGKFWTSFATEPSIFTLSKPDAPHFVCISIIYNVNPKVFQNNRCSASGEQFFVKKRKFSSHWKMRIFDFSRIDLKIPLEFHRTVIVQNMSKNMVWTVFHQCLTRPAFFLPFLSESRFSLFREIFDVFRNRAFNIHSIEARYASFCLYIHWP